MHKKTPSLTEISKKIQQMKDAIKKGSAPLERTFVKKMIVSTVHTPDKGFETAILHIGATDIVERYKTEKQAKIGHQKWVSLLRNDLDKITPLGYDNEDLEEVTLRPGIGNDPQC